MATLSRLEAARLRKRNKLAAAQRRREMKISQLDIISKIRHNTPKMVISEGNSVAYNRKTAKRSLRREEW